MLRRRSRVAIALGALFCLYAGGARADWPVARHDGRRAAVSDGASDITDPAVYWRAYLGGTIGANDFLVADLKGSGKNDVLLLTGGRLAAETPTGDSLWKSDIVGVRKLIDVVDLDGDGALDVVAATRDRVYVLAAKTGAVEWVEPEGEMGTVGGVRISDFDGDGRRDLLIQECGCCGVNSGNPGFVYAFGAGFGAAKKLWALPPTNCGVSGTTVFDPAGDGKPVVALPTLTAMRAVSGVDGSVLAQTAVLGTRIDFAACQPVDVDGVAGEELVCVQNINFGPNAGGRQLFALKYSSVPQPAFTILWQQPIGEYNGGELRARPDFVADLDGDGKVEVVASGKTAAGEWSTYVLDAVSGAVLVKVNGEQLAGTAALEAKGRLTLTFDKASAQLSAWSFVPGAPATLAQRWKLPSRAPLTYPDPERARRTSFADRLVATDLDGDGLADFLTTPVGGGADLSAHAAPSGSPKLLGSFTPATGRILSAWIVPATTVAFSQPAALTSDGFLALFDGAMSVTNKVLGDPGIPVGGYYSGGAASLGSAPIVGKLGGSVDVPLVVDSSGALVRLDASSASMASPPVVAWRRADSDSAAIVPGLASGKPGVFCASVHEPVTVPPTYDVVALRADGTKLWAAPMGAKPAFDVLPANLDGDGVPDGVVQFMDASNLVHTVGLTGSSGATAFGAEPVSVNSGLQPHAVADWDGDGRDDVVTVLDSARALSGKDGSQLVDGKTFLAYFLPTIADVDGDGVAEVTFQGGAYPARTVAHDLTKALWVGEDDQPYPYGAVVSCADGPVLVEGSSKHPSRLKITALSGAGIGTSKTLVLAGGASYADEQQAVAAKAALGALGNVNVEANLTGTGHPTAVVGSDDGWLYALDACTGKLDFTFEIGAAVGEAVFGDTDGDGKDEVLVSAADGYLYALRNKAAPGPAYVWDIDPPSGVTDHDVDSLSTTDTLYCKWAPVAGATGYEVAIAKAGGGLVSSPPWAKVGAAVTDATVAKLSLTDGAKYSCAVRALSSKGASVDVLSNGVVVHVVQGAGGAGGAGGAATGGGGHGGTTHVGGGGTSSGGAAHAGGAAHTGGAAPAPPASEATGGGCGCRVGAESRAPFEDAARWLGALVALVAGLSRRRRH
jgi:MYXO-CTERM domain-containing protein